MSEQRSNLLSNFIVRAIIGSAMIFFINEFLSAQGIAVQVGLNPWTVLTSGILGTPGLRFSMGYLSMEFCRCCTKFGFF